MNKHSLFGAALIISVASLISRILGLIKIRLLAAHFGAGIELDAYYAAFRIPDLVFSLVILGTVTAAFVPIFIEHWENNKDEALRITNTILNISLIASVGVASIAYFFAPSIVKVIAPGFDAEARSLTIMLTRIMLASPIFLVISSLLSSFLNGRKEFFAFALAPVFYNIGIIGGIIFLSPRFLILGPALGVVIGAFLHMLIQLPTSLLLGYRYRFSFDLKNEGVKKIFKHMIPSILSLSLFQFNWLVVTFIATFLPVGNLAIISWVNDIQNVPIGLVGIPLAIAVFPTLAESVGKQDIGSFLDQFNHAMRQVLFLIVPLALATIILRAQIIRLVLGSGLFGWEETRIAASALAFFSLSIFASSALPLLTRAFYALQDVATPLKVSVFSIFVTIISAALLPKIKFLPYSIDGLALAFGVSAIVSVIILFYILKKRFIDTPFPILGVFLRIALASLLACSALYGSLYFFDIFVKTETFIGIFAQTSLSVIIGSFVYLGIAVLLSMEEVQGLTKFIKRAVI